MSKNKKDKYKRDELKSEHCRVFDVVTAIVTQITDGWMTPEELDRIYLGVKERIKYVNEHKS